MIVFDHVHRRVFEGAVVVNGALVGHGWPGMLQALEVMMSEEDPTALEPDELDPDSLPDKPPVPDLPSDEELEAEDPPGDEDVPEDEYLDPEVARDDTTVDDEENDAG